jgi:hypothetical protein
MSRFYNNITVQGPPREDIINTLRTLSRRAFLSPTRDGRTVVYPDCGDQYDSQIQSLTGRLTDHLKCIALAVTNHDDDTFWYGLFDCGELLDEYQSSPYGHYIRPGAFPEPVGGDARTLCNVFNCDRVDEIAGILDAPNTTYYGYLFATDRHLDLVSVLGLPTYAVDLDYTSLEYGVELEREDITIGEITHVMHEKPE